MKELRKKSSFAKLAIKNQTHYFLSPDSLQFQSPDKILTQLDQIPNKTKYKIQRNVAITNTSCRLQRLHLSEHLCVCKEFQLVHLRLFQDPTDTLNNTYKTSQVVTYTGINLPTINVDISGNLLLFIKMV